MTRLLRAEARKAIASPLVPALSLGTLALMLLATSQVITRAGVRGAPSLGTAAHLERVLATPALGTTLLLLVGILIVTTEHRHGSWQATLLVTPQRRLVLAAKALAAAAMGALFAVVSGAAVAGLALPWMQRLGVDLPSLVTGETVQAFLGILAALPLYALIGVGVGALIRNQAGALVAALVWVLSLEQMVVARFLPRLFPWSLAGAAMAMGGADEPSNLLPALGGAVVLAGYAAVLLVAGVLALRRDVS